MSSVRASLRLRYPDQRQRTSNRRLALRTLPCRSRPCVGARARNRRARSRIGSPGSSVTTSARCGLSATSGAMARFVTYTSFASGWRRASARTSGVVSRMSPMELKRTKRTHSTSRNKSCVARLRQSSRSEEHTSELQSQSNLVCRLLLEKKKNTLHTHIPPMQALLLASTVLPEDLVFNLRLFCTPIAWKTYLVDWFPNVTFRQGSCFFTY